IPLTILIRFTLSATPGNFLTRRHNFGAAVGTITRFGAAPAAASAKTLPMPRPRCQRLGADWGSKAPRDAEPPKPRTASLSVRYRTTLAIARMFYYTRGQKQSNEGHTMAAQPLPFPDDGELAASQGLRALESGDDAATAAAAPLNRLLAVNEELKALAAIDWAAHVDANAKEAVQGLEQIFRSATAIQVSVLGAAETSGKWALDGQRNFDSWVSSQTGTTRGTAGRAVQRSKTLQDDLPATRKALAEGSISSDHAQIIARRCTKTDKHRKRLADPRQGEQFLIDHAKQMDAGKFSKVANAWAIESDPKAAERQWRQESAKEEFTLAPVEDGFHLAGWLHPVNGALLQEALSSHMGRKAADDLRPINERRADGLISLAAQSLDSGVKMPSARIRPHLTVTMEYDTIERLVHASGPLAPQSDRTCDGTE